MSLLDQVKTEVANGKTPDEIAVDLKIPFVLALALYNIAKQQSS